MKKRSKFVSRTKQPIASLAVKATCNFSLLEHDDQLMALSNSKLQRTDYYKIKSEDYE